MRTILLLLIKILVYRGCDSVHLISLVDTRTHTHTHAGAEELQTDSLFRLVAKCA